MKRVALATIALLGLAWIGWQDIPGEFLQRNRNTLADFGGIPNDGKDDSAAYYKARTTLMANGLYHLELGAGVWKFDQPLVVTAGTGGNFQTFKITGVGSNSYESTTASGTTLDFSGMDPALGMGLVIQGARGVVLEDFNVIGANMTAPLAMGVDQSDTESDWVDAGEDISTDRYAPYSGIAVDPYSGTKAASFYASIADPNTATTLIDYGTTPAQVDSANVHIRRVNVFGFVNAVCFKPSDDDDQCENSSIVDCNFRRNVYGVSMGGSQARSVSCRNVEIQYCMTAYTGSQHGKRTGVCPNIEGGTIFRVYNLFEFPGGYGNINVNGLYAETFKCIGYLGNGNTAQSYAANFTGCGFRFDSTGGSDFSGNHPVHCYSFMPTTITGGYIETRAGILNVVGSTVANKTPVLFDSVQVRAAPTAGWSDVYYFCRRKDLAAPNPVARGCSWMTDYWTSTFAPALNTSNAALTLPSRIEFGPLSRDYQIPQKTYSLRSGGSNSYVSSTITAASWIDSDTVELTASTPEEFCTDDILFWRLTAATRANSLVYDVPCLKVTGISGSTITCDAQYNPDLIDQTYQTGGGTALICQREWAPGSLVTGAATATSTSVTGVTNASTHLRIGDWVSGPGIPSKCRIRNISGTTVTLSKAATITGTANLFYGLAFDHDVSPDTPEYYGADTTGVANALPYVDAAADATGTAFIPSGHTYSLGSASAGLVLTTGQSLVGQGKNSKLTYLGSGVAVQYDDEVLVADVYIEGNTGGLVSGSSGLADGASALDYDRNFTCRNVRVSYFTNGFFSNFAGVTTIYDPYFTNCTQAVRLNGTENNVIVIVGGELRDSDYGILSDATTGNNQTFKGLTIEGNNQYGYRNTANGTTVVTFDGCYFEDNDAVSGTGADISVAGSSFTNNITIRNCNFNNTQDAINLNGAIFGEIAGNFFFNNTNSILLGASTRYIRVDGLTNRYDSATADVFNPSSDDSGFQNQTAQHPAVYGVRGNGTTDDLTGLNNWLAANPDPPPLGPGTYLVTGTVAVPDNVIWEGVNRDDVIIKAGPSQTDPVVTLGTDSRLRRLTVLGQSVASSVGIKPASNELRWLVDDVYWTLFADGFVVDSTASAGAIRNSRGFNCTATGLLVSANAPGLLVDNCNLTGSPLNVSITGAVQGMKVTNSRIASAATHGLQVTGGTLGLSITGNVFDSNTGADINLATTSQLATLIEGNRCVTTPVSVQIALADKTVIRGNSLGGTTAPIDITAAGAQRTEIGANDWTVVAYDYSTMNDGFATSYLGHIYASGDPDGTGPWERGERVLNAAPSTGTASGWVCTVGHASAATFIPMANDP